MGQVSRGLRMTEEQLIDRSNKLRKLLDGEPLSKDVAKKIIKGHMAGDKPKRIAPVDRTVNAPKYRNQKVEVDGIKFDSKKEAKTEKSDAQAEVKAPRRGFRLRKKSKEEGDK